MADANFTCESKTCSKCEQQKPLHQFGSSLAYKDGRRGQCNECRSKLSSAYSKAHPQKRAKQSIESMRRYKLATKYGITPDDYQRMLDSQNGLCAICKTDQAGGRWGRFHVDHCHTTGAVRGLLCHACNVTLGRVGDNLAGVKRFSNYLVFHEGCTI